MDEPIETGMDTGVPAYPTPPQRRILWTALSALAVTSLLGVSALVFFGFITFLGWCYPILLPIGLAVIIALVLEPVVTFVQKRGMKRAQATLLVCILTVILFLLFWAFLLPPLVSEAGGFFKSIPGMLNSGVAKLDATLSSAPETSPLELRPGEPPPILPGATNQLAIAEPPKNQTLEFPMATPESAIHSNDRSLLQEWLKTNLPSIEQTVQKNIANLVYSALGPVGQAFGFLLGFGFVPIYGLLISQ